MKIFFSMLSLVFVVAFALTMAGLIAICVIQAGMEGVRRLMGDDE